MSVREYRLTDPADLVQELMIAEGTNRNQLALKIGTSRQSLYQMLNKGKRDLRVSSFLKVLNGMGYEVLVRKCEK